MTDHEKLRECLSKKLDMALETARGRPVNQFIVIIILQKSSNVFAQK